MVVSVKSESNSKICVIGWSVTGDETRYKLRLILMIFSYALRIDGAPKSRNFRI